MTLSLLKPGLALLTSATQVSPLSLCRLPLHLPDCSPLPAILIGWHRMIMSSACICFVPAGTILSYALNSNSTNAQQRSADFNHFAIFDAHRMIACHAFPYFTIWPDPNKISCYAKYGNHPVTSILERDGSWHHIAVTWTAANDGTTKIYQDGLLMAQVSTCASCLHTSGFCHSSPSSIPL